MIEDKFVFLLHYYRCLGHSERKVSFVSKVLDSLSKFALYFFIIFLGIVITCGSIVNGILLSLLSLVFIFLFVKKTKFRRFGLFLFVISLIIRIVSIIVLKIPVRADYELMYNGSIGLIHGDLSSIDNVYFHTFSYQLGNVFYQAFILKIFNSPNILRFLNCIYSSGIVLLVYLLIRRFSKEDTARFVSLFYTISLYPLFLNSVLGNQQLSLILILLAVYIFLTKKLKLCNLILIGFLIGLGNVERVEGIIYIATIIVYLLLTEKININVFKNIFVIVVVYLFVNYFASFLVIKSGINDIGLTNRNPYWKVLTGLNLNDSGKYSASDQDLYIGDVDLEKRVILERLTDYKNLPKLFYKKINVQWLYSDLNETFNIKNSVNLSEWVANTFCGYVKCMNYFILICAFVGQIKNKMCNIEKFFMLNFCAYFVIYLFIEVNARYYYNPQVSIMILSAVGIEKLINIIDKMYKKSKMK